ncbi:MAG: urease subunit beta [Coriobacteriia bacterium]|nr:urease subunit beta [Coriobacteriia bacterium]
MDKKSYLVPGEILYAQDDIEINPGKEITTLRVSNTGDRPIQVGSHIHFAEVNASLYFDRERALGKRLDIPSGTSTRFEPGQEIEVDLVDLGGTKEVWGLNYLTKGSVEQKAEILERIAAFEGDEQ